MAFRYFCLGSGRGGGGSGPRLLGYGVHGTADRVGQFWGLDVLVPAGVVGPVAGPRLRWSLVRAFLVGAGGVLALLWLFRVYQAYIVGGGVRGGARGVSATGVCQ